MGKPIRGEGQLPYAYGGFLVNGAKIDGIAYDKELYINKQRSYTMYDLIDAAGNIYQFVRLVYRNEDGYQLDYYEIDEVLANSLEERTFYLKVQDPTRNIYGFATLYMYNLVKVHTGDYIYRTTQDASLSGVYMNPNQISLNINKSFDINANFIPAGYENKNGKWYISNNNVDGVSVETLMTVTGKTLGRCIVTFVPDANTTHAAHTVVDVIEALIEIDSLSSVIRAQDRYAYNKVGSEFTISLIIKPLTVVPSEAFEVEYDESVLEYLGTDDNLDYKFKVKPFSDSSTSFTTRSVRIGFVSTEFGEFSTQCSVNLLNPSPATSGTINGQSNVRFGTTPQYEFNPGWPYEFDDLYTWSSSNTNVASISQTGVLIPNSAGETKLTVTYKGRAFSKTVKCGNFPDKVLINPNTVTTGIVGQSTQLTATFVPSSIPVSGTWGLRHTTPYLSVSSTGLVNYLGVPPDSEVNINYIQFIPTAGGVTESPFASYTKTMQTALGTVEPTSISAYPSNSDSDIPVGMTREFSATMYPDNCTTYGFNIEVSDDTVIQVMNADDEYDMYNYPRFYNYILKGLKRGECTVTVSLKANPSMKSTYTFTVF